MYELTPLFVYKFQFMAELLIAEALTAFRLERRRLFWLRFALCVAACFGFAYALPIAAYNAWYCSVLFVALFAFSLCMMRICFGGKTSAVVFCAIAGYTVQHIAYILFDFAIIVTGINKGMPLGTYGSVSDDLFMTSAGVSTSVGGSVFASGNMLAISIWVFVYFEVYWLFYMFSSYRINKVGSIELKNMSLFFVVILILVVDVAASSFVTYYNSEKFDKTYSIMLYMYNVFCCLLALYIQFELALRKKLETDYNIVNTLWTKKNEQYNLSKENVELINLKCHDLKHQIRNIGNNAALNAETIGEIENLISIYDSSVKTRNVALDVILTEKSLICNKHGIKLSCIIDGESLDFMSEADLYSLFGNIVDNAVEAVMKLSADARVVSLTVKRVNDFLSVNIHNRFDGELEFDGSLPVTTKADKDCHGYGMKSVYAISKKYDGTLSITADNGIFNLNIIFPLPLKTT